MHAEIQDVARKTYEGVFEEILLFISNCFPTPFENQVHVPAGVLEMGINMPDHASVFYLLQKCLEDNKYLTVILDSKKCVSFPNLVGTLYAEIQDKSKLCMPSGKRSSKSSHKPEKNPVILLLQDAETISRDILEELILNCKHFMGTLPVILLFGMSSGLVTLNSILTQKALCCLGVKTFASINPMDYLTQIIEEVIISPNHPFKFGPNVFRLILDSVLFHDFSLENLTYMLKFSMLEHYMNCKGSLLCCYENEFSNQVQNLRTDELSYLKMLPSFQKFLKENPKHLAASENTSSLKKILLDLGRELFLEQKVTMVLLQILNCTTSDLPRYPLGKKFRELYGFSLKKKIFSTEAFSEAKRHLKLQSKDNLIEKFRSCLSILNDHSSLIPHSDVLQKMHTVLKESHKAFLNLTSADFEKKFDSVVKQEGDKPSSRYELMEKMRSSIKLKKSKFDALRDDVIETFLNHFEYIRPPTEYPLHELFYFDDDKLLKETLMIVPREKVIDALDNPHKYFKCQCCRSDLEDEIRKSFPDISVLYKLYKTSGKMINLTDWLEQFKSLKICDGKENMRSPRKGQKFSKAKAKNDAELNLRFLLAASELQLLGFIKVTKRKTDHVIKLTFN
ncbi:origin recognition complex subunit 3-like [Uloborus diversus]|uniref:origin recognition complex subunit 3-like n=1 Tax=Uloborus diversus TaxID=327109 RepID=UPI00240A81C7|nr:origin recognition complex subunit 3-like [Uloborus diversus]